jgi:hypothetical protein
MSKLQLAIVLSLSILMAFEPGSLGGKKKFRLGRDDQDLCGCLSGAGPALWSMADVPIFRSPSDFEASSSCEIRNRRTPATC